MSRSFGDVRSWAALTRAERRDWRVKWFRESPMPTLYGSMWEEVIAGLIRQDIASELEIDPPVNESPKTSGVESGASDWSAKDEKVPLNEEWSAEEIAKCLDVTPARVHQIVQLALCRLRQPQTRDMLEPFMSDELSSVELWRIRDAHANR